jgi:hypothetical protein
VAIVALVAAGVLVAAGFGARNVLAGTPPAPLTAVASEPPTEQKREPTPEEKRSLARINELLAQRQKAAAVRYAAQYEQFKAGRGAMDTTLDSCERLALADLEVAHNKEERIAARQEHLRRVKAILDIVSQRYNDGRASISDLKQTEYHTFGAEIDLEREKLR